MIELVLDAPLCNVITKKWGGMEKEEEERNDTWIRYFNAEIIFCR